MLQEEALSVLKELCQLGLGHVVLQSGLVFGIQISHVLSGQAIVHVLVGSRDPVQTLDLGRQFKVPDCEDQSREKSVELFLLGNGCYKMDLLDPDSIINVSDCIYLCQKRF